MTRPIVAKVKKKNAEVNGPGRGIRIPE